MTTRPSKRTTPIPADVPGAVYADEPALPAPADPATEAAPSKEDAQKAANDLGARVLTLERTKAATLADMAKLIAMNSNSAKVEELLNRAKAVDAELAKVREKLDSVYSLFSQLGGDLHSYKERMATSMGNLGADVQRQGSALGSLQQRVAAHQTALDAPAHAMALLGRLADVEKQLQLVLEGKAPTKHVRFDPPASPAPPTEPEAEEVQEECMAQEDVAAKLASLSAEVEALKGKGEVGKPRVPDLPKPPVYSGHASDMVEDKLFVFENYLLGSNIPRDRWAYHIMPLLSDKALSAWTSVAMPAREANDKLTWDMFKNTMLMNFAHPDRQHKARELLHKVSQGQNQSVTDYVRHFNALVQRAGEPSPSSTDLILFFRAGLLPSVKDKCITNPATGKFWTELKALQDYTISLHTHGAVKPATVVHAPATHGALSARSHRSSRLAVVQGSHKRKFVKKPFTNPNQASTSAAPLHACNSGRAPAGSEEEKRRKLNAAMQNVARLQKELDDAKPKN